MTLIELLVLLTWFGCGVLGALYGGSEEGFPGALAGMYVGLAVPRLILKGLLKASDAMKRKGPEFPPCANGACSRKDFTVLLDGPKDMLYTCGCGQSYVLYSEGLFRETRFDRLLEGDRLERYWARPPCSYWRNIEDGHARTAEPVS